MSSGHVRPCIFWLKIIHTTKSPWPLGVKGLGPISAFWYMKFDVTSINLLLGHQLPWCRYHNFCFVNGSTPVATLGPLHTRDWEPVTATLQAFSLVEKVEPVQVHFTLYLRDQHSIWMQDGCKVYMDSYMVSNGSCFMVTWIIFKNHLLEVGLTQNQETMALRTLTIVDLFYCIMCEDPHE